MGLPIYKITIDEEYSDGESLGINAIAFTSQPAIKVKGIAFSTQETELKQQFFADKTKNRITAPIMIPMDIYRCDEYEEYYVQFTEQEIERMHSKFMKNFANRQIFNLEHNSEDKVNAYVLETWIVDNPAEDKSFSTYGIKVPKGSVMMTAQISDSQTYSELVANDQIGFSVEGFLGLSLSEIINKKIQKETKMEEQKFEMKLPAGEYKQGDKTYIVAEDGSVSVKEDAPAQLADAVPADAPSTEDVNSGDTQTQLADAVPADPNVPAPAQDAPTDVYSKAEVDAKFDELYQMIAELKAEEITEDVVSEVPVQMNKFSDDVNFKIDMINKFLHK